MDAIGANYAGVFDHRLGFGRRPALLLIDFIAAYTQPDSPLYAPTAADAIAHSAGLYTVAKAHRVPVIFTRVLYGAGALDGGLFVQKVPVLKRLVPGEPLAAFAASLTPDAQDVVVTKQYASAFFGTSLASLLTAQGVDTLIVCGVSTSGCVRATAVDGMQHGFRVIVPRECVADRHPEPHQANLFDINAKYGDVIAASDAKAFIESRQVLERPEGSLMACPE
ncbi:isochorismatase family protein [Reyranella sp. CPCC 100927]|uniref:isochorismatase family protein n=1 Tax=Reyranella sp. CPCC 100927 TaxID=2599616 RepID=UPI00351A68E8